MFTLNNVIRTLQLTTGVYIFANTIPESLKLIKWKKIIFAPQLDLDMTQQA